MTRKFLAVRVAAGEMDLMVGVGEAPSPTPVILGSKRILEIPKSIVAT